MNKLCIFPVTLNCTNNLGSKSQSCKPFGHKQSFVKKEWFILSEYRKYQKHSAGLKQYVYSHTEDTLSRNLLLIQHDWWHTQWNHVKREKEIDEWSHKFVIWTCRTTVFNYLKKSWPICLYWYISWNFDGIINIPYLCNSYL